MANTGFVACARLTSSGWGEHGNTGIRAREDGVEKVVRVGNCSQY